MCRPHETLRGRGLAFVLCTPKGEKNMVRFNFTWYCVSFVGPANISSNQAKPCCRYGTVTTAQRNHEKATVSDAYCLMEDHLMNPPTDSTDLSYHTDVTPQEGVTAGICKIRPRTHVYRRLSMEINARICHKSAIVVAKCIRVV